MKTMQGVVLGETGRWYVDLLLSMREGDADSALAAAQSLEAYALEICADCTGSRKTMTELLCGAAGLACAVKDLESRLPTGAGAATYEGVRSVLARVRERETERVLARYEAPLELGPDERLGFAHGVAGELWALVTLLGANHAVVRARLADLAAAKELDEEGLVFWPMSRGSRSSLDLLGSWCNGMAGHVQLWCEVARQLGTPESDELAARCAESSAILLDTNPALCCGLAGHSLALERYAASSGDRRLGRRAYDRLRSAMRAAGGANAPRFLALWQGSLGVALVAMQRAAGENGFPCIEAGSPA
jgi:hypothetical protein